MMNCLPEGLRLKLPENEKYLSSIASLAEAMREKRILEAVALRCTESHDLIVDLHIMYGRIPREETDIGISEGTARDIAAISRVGKPISFVVKEIVFPENGEPFAVLSRKDAQLFAREEYLSKLLPGDVIPARITHLEPFGAFADVGNGVISLIPIDMISVSRISHPSDRFRVGDSIFAVVKSFDGKRISLSHKELLGTWEENARFFSPGETVSGIIRSVESYGVFVELTPNLAGLAELKKGVSPGQRASVYIKSINPEKMKIKLIIVDSFFDEKTKPSLHYSITEGHISCWNYSPADAARKIVTQFD